MTEHASPCLAEARLLQAGGPSRAEAPPTAEVAEMAASSSASSPLKPVLFVLFHVSLLKICDSNSERLNSVHASMKSCLATPTAPGPSRSGGAPQRPASP
eukprot:CAMPEP_0180815054 /NCGR_PEP_ID=MMETSP1038_2-20121128/67405_1 /TAXON_ID=632150 /ORGANISM="Azadinium spinosum, Strain 3D9" /LENGTH=99 /DNA_ID=CAMNT_0022856769 /DNA_START=108 /DNA_END=403 /DNA_ORIENTATION=-